MASRSSLMHTYSSAVCERAESPGPILKEGKRIRAWSLRVGEPKGVRPCAIAARTSGCVGEIREECKRVERGATSQLTC